MELDFDACYRAVASRDARFDGRIYTAVTSTRIYCRPSCPARTPLLHNVRFYRHAAAAERAGFRPCRRCRPEVSPDAPGWDLRADLVSRGLRLIAAGVVDDEGVPGLARRLAVGERHLHRLFVAELGAGPKAVANTRRAQLARQLLDDTSLPITRIAFAAGFASVRQFNATMRDVFARTPTELRIAGRPPSDAAGEALTLRLRYRPPLPVRPLLDYLEARAVPGVEGVRDGRYRRSVAVGGGAGILELEPVPSEHLVLLRLWAEDVRGLASVAQGARSLLDLSADTSAIEARLAEDPLLAPLVAARPGLRLPGAFDGFELAVRTVLGQQVSVAAASTLTGRLVRLAGKPLTAPSGSVTHLFPDAATVAAADLADLGVPAGRVTALRALASAVAGGDVALDGAAPAVEVHRRLLSVPGIGPWTAGYLAMRVLRDPDALPEGDLGLRRALERAGLDGSPRALAQRAERWRPWRGYAAMHLWTGLSAQRKDVM